MKGARELFGFGVLPFLIAGIIWLPAWIILLVLSAGLIGAGHELLSMARSDDRPCGTFLPLALLAGIMISSWLFGLIGLAAGIALTLVLLPAAQMAHPDAPRGAMNAVSVSVFVVIYIGVTGSCLGWIRSLDTSPDGYHMLMIFLASIWGGDTGAYYTGKNLGRHRMAPAISPKKTWEGLAGGIFGSLLGAALMKTILADQTVWIHIALLATISAISGPIGDLVISQFKRDTGVKDSSTILPGHGGLLDRADSLLFAAPVFLAYLLAMGLYSLH